MAALFLAGLAPFLLQADPPHDDEDHKSWHVPTIRAIAAHFPVLDLASDPKSAVAPGYHYLLAGLWRAGADEGLLRGIHAAVSLALPLLLAAWAGRRLRPWEAMLALAPLVLSPYVLKAAAWIVTDNPALLGMAAVMVRALDPRADRGRVAVLAGLLAATVAVRQSYFWLAAPAALSVWCARPGLQGAVRAALAVVPAALVLVVLVMAWGGLVPPAWRGINQDPSASPVLHAAALAACILGLPAVAMVREFRVSLRIPAVAGCAGLILVLLFPTFPSMEEGRWGGVLWRMAEHVPAPGGRSLVLVFLAPAGAAAIAWWGCVLRLHAGVAGWMWLAGLGVWMLSLFPNPQAFQRYAEPPLWIFLILAFGMLGGIPVRVRWMLGAMAMVQVAGLGWLMVRS